MTAWVVVVFSFSYELPRMSLGLVLKDGLDIVRVVSGYVPLEKQGGRYVGLCPFHTEKTPSFGVNPQLRIFKMFRLRQRRRRDRLRDGNRRPHLLGGLQAARREVGIPLPERDF